MVEMGWDVCAVPPFPDKKISRTPPLAPHSHPRKPCIRNTNKRRVRGEVAAHPAKLAFESIYACATDLRKWVMGITSLSAVLVLEYGRASSIVKAGGFCGVKEGTNLDSSTGQDRAGLSCNVFQSGQGNSTLTGQYPAPSS